MLNNAFGVLIKKVNIVLWYWSLYNQLLENLKNIIFNLNIFLFL
jgi:hypothetical protein